MARRNRRSGRRGGRRTRNGRRAAARTQTVILTQRGLIGQANSVGASISSLTGGGATTTYYPLWFKLQLASTGKSFYQVQTFSGTGSNDMIQTWAGLISEGTRVVAGRYPRFVGGVSSLDYSQNLLEIDHPCMNMKETDDTNLYYHLQMAFRLPFPAVPDTCPAVNGTPKPSSSSSTPFEMM